MPGVMTRICRRAHAPLVYQKKKNLHMLGSNNKVSKMKTEWPKLDWRAITIRVSRIQRQIYKRASEGKEVHGLQRVLTELFEAKLLAVRRVTQDNTGKNTASRIVAMSFCEPRS